MMSVIWKSLLLIFTGAVLLRFAGRKSISQLSVVTTVVMISIGTIIVQPIAEKGIWKAVLAATVFIVFLVAIEWLELKFDSIEHLFTGKAIEVVRDGQILPENMRKLRFTVDKLETRIRQYGITKISDLKSVTLEPNGQVGYELKEEAKPLTVGQFESLVKKLSGHTLLTQQPVSADPNIFQEVHSGTHTSPVPEPYQ